MSKELTAENFKEIKLDVKLVRGVGDLRKALIMELVDNKLPVNEDGFVSFTYDQLRDITGFFKTSTVYNDTSRLVIDGFLEKKVYGRRFNGYKPTQKYHTLKH